MSLVKRMLMAALGNMSVKNGCRFLMTAHVMYKSMACPRGRNVTK